jgi:lysyl-tRNA synthetase class 2
MVDNGNILELRITDSKCISGFRYDKTKKILRVDFCHGGYYDYADIDEGLVRRWMKAESKGKFFNKEIRK